MHRFRDDFQISVSPEFYISAALLLLLLPIKWLLAWALASSIHELFHYLAIRLSKTPIHSIAVGLQGITIKTGNMSYTTELFCALAGPVGALLVLTVAKWLPLTAVCAYFQSAYNLLPIFPLDGGRALRCFAMQAFSAHTAERFCRITQTGMLVLLILLGIYCSIWLHLGMLPTVIALLLLLKNRQVKFPCKDGKLRVQ